MTQLNPMLAFLNTQNTNKEDGAQPTFVPPAPAPLSLSFLLPKPPQPDQLEAVHEDGTAFEVEKPVEITATEEKSGLGSLLKIPSWITKTDVPIECGPGILAAVTPAIEAVVETPPAPEINPADIVTPTVPVDLFATLFEAPAPPPVVLPPPVIAPPPITLPGATPVSMSPFSNARNPFKTSSGNYEIVLPQNATKRQIEIKESGIKVEDLPQEDLREVYYLLKGRMNSLIWRASTINDVDKRGEPRKEDDREESEWMFTGSAIHEAMETQGESLKKLFHFGGLGEEPTKPDSALSKDHIDMMREIIVNKVSSTEAYIKVKDNLSTKNIQLEWLAEGFEFPCEAERERLTAVLEQYKLRYDDYVAGNLTPEDLTEEEQAMTGKQLEKKMLAGVKSMEQAIKAVKDSEEFKAVSKVSKAALTEFEKFKDELPKFEKYLKDMANYELRKDQVREKAKAVEGSVVLDDIPYTTTRGFRIYETIAKTYGALANSKEAFDVYHPYKVSDHKFECFSEYVVLYDFTLPTGKKVPFMSMMDRYIIDHTAKVAWVIDLKTYGKMGNFIHVNYKDHAYWRAMAVYYEAARIDLERRGLGDYKIQTSILPISIVSLEVGVCGIPLLNLSSEEIRMGTNGGMMKFQGSVFNDRKEICTAMSEKLMQHFIETDQISANSPEFYVRGWKRIVEDFEMRKVPSMASVSA